MKQSKDSAYDESYVFLHCASAKEDQCLPPENATTGREGLEQLRLGVGEHIYSPPTPPSAIQSHSATSAEPTTAALEPAAVCSVQRQHAT